MPDLDAIDLAFRARCAALVVATTGTMELAATTTGFTRATGSFVTDGFTVGSEVTPSGFTQTTRCVITAVTATTLTVSGGRSAQASGSGRSLSVGLPAIRIYDNAAPQEDSTVLAAPVGGRPYVEADFVPQPAPLFAGPAQGGVVDQTGLYVVRWYGIASTGASGIRKAVTALADRFTPGTTFTAGSYTVRVRGFGGEVAPSLSQITQRPGGWALCVLTIPWRVHAFNTVV